MPPTRDMNLIEVAFTLANEAHWKVRSLRGRPYIFHAIRVMEQMDTDEECAVALLHEVLEDSSPSLPVEM
ncbi:MAG: hypothetical protein MJA29_11585, partial [Candidatus Omnitrophica bacterium]|nr:hypothetical protein [Candidatus Omnitrophota bacterium]